MIDQSGPRVARIGGCLLVLLVELTACTGSRPIPQTGSPPTLPKTSPTTVEVPRGVEPNGSEKVLALPDGFAYRTYDIQALDPPTHTYTVRLSASGRPDLEVWLESDVPLRVTETPRSKIPPVPGWRAGLCANGPFPALEARPDGTWTVHVLKRTNPPSTARITVLFETTG